MNPAIVSLLRTRLVHLYIFLFCGVLLGFAYYMQYFHNMEPCPLCIMQRVFFFASGFAALAAFIHNPQAKGVRIYGFGTAALALAGSGFALRQIYLQNLPEDLIPQCLPSISYMLESDFPLSEVVTVLFAGDGNCADVLWVDPVLGLGFPQWAVACFAMIAATGIYQALRK